MGRPRVPLLSREKIRLAALAIIDNAGLGEMSMRKLAAELGVQAASLYRHYPTKDDVLDDIVAHVYADIDTSSFDRGDDWTIALPAWARSYRDALAAHPNLVPYLASGPGQREKILQVANAVQGGLVGNGWPPREAALIGAATRSLVIGTTLGSFSRGYIDDIQFYRERYPNLEKAHLLRGCADEMDDASFELALGALIDGFSAQLAAIQNKRGQRRTKA